MKKHTLLGAAALTTVALVGQAHAGTLTAGTVAGSTVSENRIIASEVKLDSATNAKGVIGAILTPSPGAILPSGNSLLTVDLTGGATFGVAVTPGAVVANAGCAPTTTISKGGSKTDSSVTFLVSGLDKCTNAVPIHLAVPALLSTTNAVNVTTNLTTELGTPIDGGTATTQTVKGGVTTNLLAFAPAFSVKATVDKTATKATLASGFKALTDPALGTVVIAADVASYVGIAAVTKVSADDITKAALSVTGDLTTVDVSVDNVAAFTANPVKYSESTKGSGTGTVTTNKGTTATGTYAFTAAPTSGPAVIKGSTYSTSVTLTTTAAYNAPAAFGPGSLETITREGSTYVIAWVASGALAASSSNTSVVRLSNIGTATTGAVSIELIASSNGTKASTALIPVAAAGIPAGRELVLTSQSFTDALSGTDFQRGDFRITVESQPGDLLVRRFIQNGNTGALTEVSLGRTATGGGSEPVN